MDVYMYEYEYVLRYSFVIRVYDGSSLVLFVRPFTTTLISGFVYIRNR